MALNGLGQKRSSPAQTTVEGSEQTSPLLGRKTESRESAGYAAPGSSDRRGRPAGLSFDSHDGKDPSSPPPAVLRGEPSSSAATSNLRPRQNPGASFRAGARKAGLWLREAVDPTTRFAKQAGDPKDWNRVDKDMPNAWALGYNSDDLYLEVGSCNLEYKPMADQLNALRSMETMSDAVADIAGAYLNSPFREVRHKAIEVLRKLGGPEAFRVLNNCYRDRRPPVETAAKAKEAARLGPL